MTNNHVLNENNLRLNKPFIISKANNEKDTIEIQIKSQDFVFTSELFDVTFIELNDEVIDDIEPEFLRPSAEDAKKGESILIFQYANAEYSLAHGNIKFSLGFDYYHEVKTSFGSSGSPLINKDFEVVGIHKSKKIEEDQNNEKKYINKATKYSEIEFAIRRLYNNKNIYGIKRARKSVKKLKESEINDLKEYGLQLRLSTDQIDKIKNDINKLKEKEHEKEIKLRNLEYGLQLRLSTDQIDKIKNDINKLKEKEHKKEIKLKNLEILKKSLFSCTFSKKLLFYRTNYAWYITILSKRDNNYISKDEYNLDNIKQLEWIRIIPNRKELIKKIDSKIKNGIGREYILTTWLGLTDFKYL